MFHDFIIQSILLYLILILWPCIFQAKEWETYMNLIFISSQKNNFFLNKIFIIWSNSIRTEELDFKTMACFLFCIWGLKELEGSKHRMREGVWWVLTPKTLKRVKVKKRFAWLSKFQLFLSNTVRNPGLYIYIYIISFWHEQWK